MGFEPTQSALQVPETCASAVPPLLHINILTQKLMPCKMFLICSKF